MRRRAVRPSERPAGGGTWLAAFAALFAMGAVWSLAVPLFAAPDEPSQTVRAASVARGQLSGPRHVPPGRPEETDVRLPAFFASAHRVPKCLLGHRDVGAACSPPLSRSHRPVETGTLMGRYPPGYYAVVGLPSRWWASPAGVHLMRLVSAALTAAVLASAVVTARNARSPGAAAGLVLATTPMVLFLSGSVNPNGLEVAAAIGLWLALLASIGGSSEPAGRLAVRGAVAAAVLANARPLGPVWLGVVVAVAGVVGGRARLRALWRVGSVRVAAVATAAATAVAVAWNALAHSYQGIGDERGPVLTTGQYALQSLGRTWDRTLQMVGVFGWTDTHAPLLAYAAWLGATGLVVLLALRSGDRRVAAALALLAAVVVALPVPAEASKHIGFWWLGRYTLPLAAGVPLIAGWAAGPVLDRHRAAVRAGALALCAAHVGALAWTLRRFTAGVDGTYRPRWAPPAPAPVLLAALAVAAVAWWVVAVAGRPPFGLWSAVLDLRAAGGPHPAPGEGGAGGGEGDGAPAEPGAGEPGAVHAVGGDERRHQGVETGG